MKKVFAIIFVAMMLLCRPAFVYSQYDEGGDNSSLSSNLSSEESSAQGEMGDVESSMNTTNPASDDSASATYEQ